MQVVVVAVKLRGGFGTCDKGVGHAHLEHAVKHGKERVAGLRVLTQRLDGRSRNALLQDFVNTGGLHDFELHRRITVTACVQLVYLRLQGTVLGKLVQEQLQVFRNAVGLVAVETEDSVHLFGGTGLFSFDFLFGLGHLEIDGGDNRACAHLAQVRSFGLEGDVAVRKKENGGGNNQKPSNDKVNSHFFLFHSTTILRKLSKCLSRAGGGARPSTRIPPARFRGFP